MAVSGIQPFIKVTDSNGLPYVGAILRVYAAGTTTYINIYSDDDLITPLANPLTGLNASNASGDFPRFFMASGTYKLRAEQADGTLIWEYDDIDTGLSAGAGALPISAGGTGATTAAGARTNLDVPSNSELQDLSDQIVDFSASLSGIISQPGGRLTLTSATPVLAASVTAATAIYYTPYASARVPVYDGTQYNLQEFSELTLTLVANHTANSIYDCFIINDSGTIRIVTGPAWNTATAGAGARGTGAGTTELTRLNGLWVNANAMATARNGSSTYSVDANKGTYVGSIYMDGSNGQISCHVAYGQSRKFGVWNAYNRKTIILKAGDATASWPYTTATIRASNGSSANSLTVFAGLPEEFYDISHITKASSNQVSINFRTGIGYNSTSAFSGYNASRWGTTNDGTTSDQPSTMTSFYTAPPSLGINVVTSLEYSTAAGTSTWYGTEANMLLTAKWDG